MRVVVVNYKLIFLQILILLLTHQLHLILTRDVANTCSQFSLLSCVHVIFAVMMYIIY